MVDLVLLTMILVTRYRIVIAVLSRGPGGEWGEQAEHERKITKE